MDVNKEEENKILMTDDIVYLDKFVKKSFVRVVGNCTLNAINLHNNMSLIIEIEKNSVLVLNIFDYAVLNEVTLDITLDDGASLILNDAFIAEKKYGLYIDTKLYGSNANVYVNVRGINEENATSTVIMNGCVAGGIDGVTLNEYAKVINKSDNSAVLIPNLIVNTNEVEANHGVSIGSINRDELFYLMSKGISNSDASKMIENGFLLSIMGEDVKEKIKNVLVGR